MTNRTIISFGRCVLAGAAFALVLASTSTQSVAGPGNSTDEQIRGLIDQLGDADIPRRYQAAKRLVEMGGIAVPALRKAASDHPSEDVRLRAAVVMRDAEQAAFTVVREFRGDPQLRPVLRVVLTADGKRMLSSGSTGVILWEVETGKLVRNLGEPNRINWALAISRDGKRAIGGANDRSARVWDLATGQEIQKLAGHTQPIWGVALTADGRQAVTGARDKSIRVWDVESGKELRSFQGVTDRIRALALSPDERYVAASHFPEDGRPGTLRLWDLAEGRLIRSYAGHSQPITSVSFSRDGKTLITTAHDRIVRFWETESGKEIKKFVIEKSLLEGAALSDDGQFLITCGAETGAAARLWDVTTGTLKYSSEPSQTGFLSAAMLPDGHSAVVACQDGVVRLWRWK